MNGYRLRVGTFRVLFDVNGIIIDIIDIGNRGQIYKGASCIIKNVDVENPRALPLRTLRPFSARILLRSQRKSGLIVFPTGIIKEPFIMRGTSASIGITAKRQMPAARSSFAASNVLPVLPVTRPAEIFKKNAAVGWTKLLTFATAVLKS